MDQLVNRKDLKVWKKRDIEDRGSCRKKSSE